jgi:hypothetical protein
VGDPDADLIVPAVRRLVAEEEQVEGDARRLLGPDRVGDGAGGRHRIPFGGVGLQEHGAVDADRHRVAELLDRHLGPERQDGALAPVRRDEAHGLLHRALLVGAHGEAQVAGVDLLLVRGQRELAGGRRHALDADEDVHRRIRRFWGSKSGVLPATATVTG